MSDDAAVMLFACAKADREDLTHDEKKAALALLKEFENDGR